ncbi:hypothetical protein J3R83DRAFT_12537 [Lanmaoa asiatica]|nr:hypothetical protein J3R83DRAFT_12537 [Lanmaoa asiatica]
MSTSQSPPRRRRHAMPPQLLRLSVPPALTLQGFDVGFRHDGSDAEVIFQLNMQIKPRPNNQSFKIDLACEVDGVNEEDSEEDTKFNTVHGPDATMQCTNDMATGITRARAKARHVSREIRSPTAGPSTRSLGKRRRVGN